MLALFDLDVSDDEKQLMAVILLSKNPPAPFETGKPGQPGFRPITDKLEDVFITERFWMIFRSAATDVWLTYQRPNHPEDTTKEVNR